MRIVVDASVAVKWVCAEPDSQFAVALRSEDLIAPSLWLAEGANALCRRVRIGDITADDAHLLFSELENAPLTSLATEPLLADALRLAIELFHPIYDCVYLTAALNHATHVVTADRRFAAVADRSHLSGRVRLLGS